jgi:hypothetical protein
MPSLSAAAFSPRRTSLSTKGPTSSTTPLPSSASPTRPFSMPGVALSWWTSTTRARSGASRKAAVLAP